MYAAVARTFGSGLLVTVIGCKFHTVVFDIGGSHATASLVCDESFTLHHTSASPLSPVASKNELLDSLEQLARRVLSEAGAPMSDLSGIGFAMPGPFDYELGISHMQHKHASLFGVSVRQEVATRLSLNPESITFINDAAAFVLGEIASGAARQARRVVGITLGTGVGSGFAVDGQIVTSGPGVPAGGEIWNVNWGAGIFEDAISTRAIQGIYRSLTGVTLEVKEIASRCPSESAAVETFATFGKELGDVLNSIAEAFHPNIFVIGGAIARSSELFLPNARERLKDSSIQIVVSKLFEDAALVGAGAKWLQLARSSAAPKGISNPDVAS